MSVGVCVGRGVQRVRHRSRRRVQRNLTGGARWSRPNRSHLARARLGKLLPVPSPSSNIGIFKFRKTDIIVNEPDDEAYHEFDYFSVYERVPDASACRRPDRIHSMRSDSVCVRHVI